MLALRKTSRSSLRASCSDEQLIAGFEAKTGHKVKATFGQEDGTKQQIIKGEAFDVPLLETTGKTPIDAVTASGNVVVSSATPVANIFVGVAVRKGAHKPDISTPDAVKRMLLDAEVHLLPGSGRPEPAWGSALTTPLRSSASPSNCCRKRNSGGAAAVP